MKPQEKLNAARNEIFNGLFVLQEILSRIDSQLITDVVADQLNAISIIIKNVTKFADLIFQIENVGVDFRLLERKCEIKYGIEQIQVIGDRSDEIPYNGGRLFRLEKVVAKNDPEKFSPQLQYYYDVLTKKLNENISLLEEILKIKPDQENIENFKRQYSERFSVNINQVKDE